MLNHRAACFTLFGREINRLHLNWGNTILLLLKFYILGKSLKDNHHSDLNDASLEEKFLSGLIFLSLIMYIVINKNQISQFANSSYHSMRSPWFFSNNTIFVSDTLKSCIERGKKINNKLKELNIVSPEKFNCPISLDTMCCPIRATDGKIYDYKSICNVIESNGTSPMTREKLANVVAPDVELQDEIETWIDQQLSAKNAMCRIKIV